MKPILYERRGSTGYITLNRASAANALDRGMILGLQGALGQARTEKIRVCVLQGTEGRFCGGADLKERQTLTLDETRAYLEELGKVTAALESFPGVTIAAIDGVALGGGLELALACDLRIATDRSELGLPEVRVGIIPGAGGTARLPRLIGLARAKEMVLLGSRISALQAESFGLVSKVVEHESLEWAVTELVDQIEQTGPLAIAQAKQSLEEGLHLPLGEALALERRLYERVLTSEDRNEGLRAFAEKRKPVYQGK